MKRLYWLFGFFCFGALVDLAGTIWNLSFLGYGFEGNPLIDSWYSAVIIKIAVVMLIYFSVVERFEKQNLWHKYTIVSLFLIAGLVQILAGGLHLYVYNQYASADEVVITEKGDVLIMQDGGVVDTLTPVVETSKKLVYYFKVVGLLILYPYLMGLLGFRTLWWVLDRKD